MNMKYLNIKKALTAWQNLQPLSEKDRERLSRRFTVDFNYNSNHIEGNTLTLKETKVVLEGITIGGKSVREHIEAINHENAIEYLEELIGKYPNTYSQIANEVYNILQNPKRKAHYENYAKSVMLHETIEEENQYSKGNKSYSKKSNKKD